jgi:hypothetical protein
MAIDTFPLEIRLQIMVCCESAEDAANLRRVSSPMAHPLMFVAFVLNLEGDILYELDYGFVQSRCCRMADPESEAICCADAMVTFRSCRSRSIGLTTMFRIAITQRWSRLFDRLMAHAVDAGHDVCYAAVDADMGAELARLLRAFGDCGAFIGRLLQHAASRDAPDAISSILSHRPSQWDERALSDALFYALWAGSCRAARVLLGNGISGSLQAFGRASSSGRVPPHDIIIACMQQATTDKYIVNHAVFDILHGYYKTRGRETTVHVFEVMRPFLDDTCVDFLKHQTTYGGSAYYVMDLIKQIA